MKLVFATNNLHKLKEVQEMLSNSIEVLSLKDIGCFEDIEETERTLEGNAKLKADYITKKYGFDCFADDTGLEVESFIDDGSEVSYGDVVFQVSGNSQSILKAERFVLNAMQRMSAIATKTNFFVNLLKGTKTQILDTRKTTPGIRALEKWAVKIGGGENHRFALYDMIMIKDNHIDFAGGISEAITKTKNYLINNKLDLKIIVEARSISEIEEILQNEGVYRILIDNFSFEDTRKAVALINGKCFTESSGGINEDTIRKYAECGVDYISSGALTHSVYNMDLSLKAVN